MSDRFGDLCTESGDSPTEPRDSPTEPGKGSARWRGLRPPRPASLLLPLVASLCLVGCAPTNDRLWPSIEPRPRGQVPGRRPQEPRPFFSLLPGSVWELAGGIAFLAGAGSLGYLYWKFPSLLERFDELQRASEKLARRRDQGTVDLVSLSRRVSQLNSQLDNLHGELAGRPAHDVQESLQEVSDLLSQAQNQGREELEALRSYVAYLNGQFEALQGGLAAYFNSQSALSEAALRSEPAATRRDPLPLEEASPPRRRQRQAPEVGPETPGARLPSLGELVDAVNGRGGTQPLHGVNFVQLDVAELPEELVHPDLPLPVRLKLVSDGGRFLLVMLNGDAWLFPALPTLEHFAEQAEHDAEIFAAIPVAASHPELRLPAQLREVGGLWEVTEKGEILIPA